MTRDANTESIDAIVHVVKILDSVTEELKSHSRLISESDKKLAVIDEKLKAVDKIVYKIEKKQAEKDLIDASRVGGERVKWVILSIIGSAVIAALVKLAISIGITKH